MNELRFNGIIIWIAIQKEKGIYMFKAIWKFIKILFTLCIIIALLAAVCIGYARFIEPERLVVRDITDTDPSIKQTITVAVFGDTHFGFNYDTDNFQKVVDEVNANPPDILIFAGDLIDNLEEYTGDTTMISRKLSEMNANIGKYAVFGNHDYGGGAEWEYEDIMNSGGFTVLKNEIITFDNYNLRLIGIDDVLIGYGDPSIANKADADMYNLVICHEPDVVDYILDSNTDYMVAAHTHGGQICVPFYTEEFMPSYGEKYVKGEYLINNENQTIVYVTSGLGTTRIPARFGAVPELTYLTIIPE